MDFEKRNIRVIIHCITYNSDWYHWLGEIRMMFTFTHIK